MFYPLIIDKLTISPDAAPGTLTTATRRTARIQQQVRRLEGLLLHIVGTTNATAGANAQDGWPGILKEVRLKVEDVLGPRNIIACTGPALLSYCRNAGLNIDRKTAQGYKTSQLTNSTAYDAYIYIPVRAPQVQEPFGNCLSLPLSSKWLRGDPVLEIDFRATSELFAQAVGSVSLDAWAFLREVPDTLTYIPSELISTQFVPNTTGVAQFDLPTKGYLVSVLVQGYSAAAYASSVTRVSCLSSGGTHELQYGREIKRILDDQAAQAMNDWSQVSNFIDTTNDDQLFAGEWFLDLLTDHPCSDAYSIGSILNLEPVALKGDKCTLKWKNWANAAYAAMLTTHRLFPVVAEDLRALAAAI